jgi:hypothetical protein
MGKPKKAKRKLNLWSAAEIDKLRKLTVLLITKITKNVLPQFSGV